MQWLPVKHKAWLLAKAYIQEAVRITCVSCWVVQVALTTFDTPSELAKLARWHPSARALLRIRADDPAARCQLGNKYGADPDDARALLKV